MSYTCFFVFKKLKSHFNVEWMSWCGSPNKFLMKYLYTGTKPDTPICLLIATIWSIFCITWRSASWPCSNDWGLEQVTFHHELKMSTSLWYKLWYCKATPHASDCVPSAEAYPSAGEEVDDHRRPPPTCQGGPVPLLHQAVRGSGLPPESRRHCPGDDRPEQSQQPQIPPEWGDFPWHPPWPPKLLLRAAPPACQNGCTGKQSCWRAIPAVRECAGIDSLLWVLSNVLSDKTTLPPTHRIIKIEAVL